MHIYILVVEILESAYRYRGFDDGRWCLRYDSFFPSSLILIYHLIGSYVGAGYIISSINVSGPVTDFARWLDLDEGVARSTWTQSNQTFIR